jgi:hypothetical protein
MNFVQRLLSRKICSALTIRRILHIFISLSYVAMRTCIKKSIENIPVSQCLFDPPRVPVLSQMNPAHTLTSYFLEIRQNFVFPSISGSSAWFLSFRSFDQNLVCTPLFFSPVCYLTSSHLPWFGHIIIKPRDVYIIFCAPVMVFICSVHKGTTIKGAYYFSASQDPISCFHLEVYMPVM